MPQRIFPNYRAELEQARICSSRGREAFTEAGRDLSTGRSDICGHGTPGFIWSVQSVRREQVRRAGYEIVVPTVLTSNKVSRGPIDTAVAVATVWRSYDQREAGLAMGAAPRHEGAANGYNRADNALTQLQTGSV